MIHLITTYGQYVLSVFGLIGIKLAGRRNAWGWLISLCSQLAWATYIAATGQWGLMIGTCGYAWVYLQNFRSWRRDQRTERQDQP